jgi:hypothetical protein
MDTLFNNLLNSKRWLGPLVLILFCVITLPARADMSLDMTVYKSESCGCCIHWMEHLESNGISSTAQHPADLSGLKGAMGIRPQMQSCHTGVVDDQYVFEGHVPAKLIKQFMDSPPEGSIGLSVPRMPVGSPGMEVGDRFDAYQVMLLMDDGSAQIYATINSPAEQY